MAKQLPVRTRSPALPSAVGSIEERFAELAGQFDLLKAQVRQAQQLTALGTAAAMLAHEVNNLLTPMLAYADAAVASADSELMKKALGVTAKNVRILIAMSDRVLEIGAAKPGRREAIRVRRSVEDAAASLCRDLAKDGIDFSLQVDSALEAWADPLQLQQVFFNLFLNAREAMAPRHSGRLTVRAEREDDRVVVTIRNTGEPIPAELVPRVFEPYQTSKPSERGGRPRCGGLGLALCRDLVTENEGTITVHSDRETGTTFTITLPATQSACS